MTARTGATNIDAVVKVGGGLLGRRGAFRRVTAALATAAGRHRLVILPGGGPFADAVRELNRRIQLGEDAAHWMAILGMDQYAHALAASIPGATLVEDAAAIGAALERGGLPVLAPFRWLRLADPLPHSWNVTSDSIAAWVARALGAPRLVLVKPVGGAPAELSDAHFAQALDHTVQALVVAADDMAQLERLLGPIQRMEARRTLEER